MIDGAIPGRRPRREAALLDEVSLELRRIDALAVGIVEDPSAAR